MSEEIDVIPLTVTIPHSLDSLSLIEIVDDFASLKAVFVERDSISTIPDVWKNSCGFYILFSRIEANGSYSVYVGKSNRDFTSRIRSHDQAKDYWTTALLVQRNSVQNLSSTQSSYLEGALRDIFDQAPHVTCKNIAPTGDYTLPAHERLLMRQVVDATFRMMLLRGYRQALPVKPVTPSDAPVPPSLFKMSVPSIPLQTAGTKGDSTLLVQPLREETEHMNPHVPSTEYREAFGFSALLKGKAIDRSYPAETSSQAHKKEDTFQTLREWRIQKARDERISPAYVFSDRVLRELADKMPETGEELLLVSGISALKKEKYGHDLLKILDNCR